MIHPSYRSLRLNAITVGEGGGDFEVRVEENQRNNRGPTQCTTINYIPSKRCRGTPMVLFSRAPLLNSQIMREGEKDLDLIDYTLKTSFFQRYTQSEKSH